MPKKMSALEKAEARRRRIKRATSPGKSKPKAKKAAPKAKRPAPARTPSKRRKSAPAGKSVPAIVRPFLNVARRISNLP